MRIGAVVLAAGKASRFGSPKQLLRIGGETLVDRACRTALQAGCHPVLRLLGSHAEEILRHPGPNGVETFVHPAWEDGMGSSLAAGVTHLLDLSPGIDALFVLLADQPMVTPDLLKTMAAELETASIVLCRYADVTGPPALFTRRHFPALRALDGDRGAKSVAAGQDLATVPFDDGAWDIDSPGAWEKFQSRSGFQ